MRVELSQMDPHTNERTGDHLPLSLLRSSWVMGPCVEAGFQTPSCYGLIWVFPQSSEMRGINFYCLESTWSKVFFSNRSGGWKWILSSYSCCKCIIFLSRGTWSHALHMPNSLLVRLWRAGWEDGLGWTGPCWGGIDGKSCAMVKV